MTEIRKYWLVLAVMLYVAYVTMMWKWGHQGDMMFWWDWTKYMYENGFTSIYDNGCNYMPAYLYFLYFHVKIQCSLTNIQDNLYTIKYYTLLFDFLGAVAAVWFVKDDFKKLIYFLLLMFNVAYIYNTVMWAQVDAIFTFFGFAAVVAALERKIVISILLLLLSLNFKLQGLVFIPVVGLLLLPQILTRNGMKQLLWSLAAVALLQVLILLPFILKGRIHQVLGVITGSVGHYPFPSLAAFNIWFLLIDKDIDGMRDIIDTDTFFILSYKHLGYLMFFTALLIAVFPLIKHQYNRYIKKMKAVFSLEKVFLISSLVPLAFFYFNAEMHDRYSHPALISLAAYAFSTRRFIPLMLGSVAYFLNMEKILRYLALTNYDTLIFHPRLVSVLFLILISYLYYLLYTKPSGKPQYTQVEL